MSKNATTETNTIPTEELRAAATKLRETASAATGGPWEDTEDLLWIGGSIWGYSIPKGGTFSAAKDSAWIALANPSLAEPLAEWLEMEAHMAEKQGMSLEGNTFHALKVARTINAT